MAGVTKQEHTFEHTSCLGGRQPRWVWSVPACCAMLYLNGLAIGQTFPACPCRALRQKGVPATSSTNAFKENTLHALMRMTFPPWSITLNGLLQSGKGGDHPEVKPRKPNLSAALLFMCSSCLQPTPTPLQESRTSGKCVLDIILTVMSRKGLPRRPVKH